MANIKRLNQLMERGDENIGYQEWHDFLIDRTAALRFLNGKDGFPNIQTSQQVLYLLAVRIRQNSIKFSEMPDELKKRVLKMRREQDDVLLDWMVDRSKMVTDSDELVMELFELLSEVYLRSIN